MKLFLRDIQLKDLDLYMELTHPKQKFHSFNGPYFKQRTEKELQQFINILKEKIEKKESNILENKKLIVDENDNILWEVNWYWKSKETLWIEVWVIIFNENYWWKWIWYTALKQWINEIFENHTEIIRIWLTTWSWNIGMMKLAEKLGLEKEATYRKARIVNWEYYDSVSYWILKEDWYQ